MGKAFQIRSQHHHRCHSTLGTDSCWFRDLDLSVPWRLPFSLALKGFCYWFFYEVTDFFFIDSVIWEESASLHPFIRDDGALVIQGQSQDQRGRRAGREGKSRRGEGMLAENLERGWGTTQSVTWTHYQQRWKHAGFRSVLDQCGPLGSRMFFKGIGRGWSAQEWLTRTLACLCASASTARECWSPAGSLTSLLEKKTVNLRCAPRP